MKRLSLIIVLLLAGCCSGPRYPKEMVLEVQKNAARMQRYIEYMEKNETTRIQDAKMLEANYAAWRKLEEVVK